MNDARNEATPMNNVRDAALHGVTSYQKGKKVFERANGFKTISFDGSVSFIDTSMCKGRVRDRKQFFEHRIIKQQRKENELISPTLSSSTSPTTGHSEGPSVIEERTDSESFVQYKGDRIEHEEKDSRSVFHSKSERMGPTESSSTEFHHKWESKFDSGWGTDYTDVFEQESSNNSIEEKADRTSQTFQKNKLKNSNPNVGIIALSDSYIQKAKSLDAKVLSLPNISDADTKEKEKEEERSPSEEDTRQEDEGNARVQRSSEVSIINDELVRKKKKSNRPIVKIQITSTKAENQNIVIDDQERKDISSSAISERKINIDEMITEFQQASAMLSDKFMATSSPRERVKVGCSAHRLNSIEIHQDDEIYPVRMTDNTRAFDSSFAPNTLTANDLNELTERLHATHQKEKVDMCNYVCPSESTDYSIDSKGNSKTTKSLSSKSAKSSIKLKVKGNGMGKMLKKAKKGMEKSVKNLTSIVKNTMKTKPTKQSLAATEQLAEENSDKVNCKEVTNIFDEKLAEELVKASRDESWIVIASQYLDCGNRLLRNKEETEKAADPTISKEIIQKAHTYAYVGRQLAKQYLLTCHQENLKRTGTNVSECAPSENDDDINVLEEFFFSFLQCVGPCTRDDDFEHSRRQISGALEILSNLSDEETSVVKGRLSKEIKKEVLAEREMKVELAIADNRDSADRDDIIGMENAARERRLAIHSFMSALQSFYENDNTMKLLKTFPRFSEDRRDDASDSSRSFMSNSLSYNYSESLKFDQDCSFNTRSFASSVGSMKQEKPSSCRRRRKLKEESLAEGIHPGTTVVSISVQNRSFQKKKHHSPKKWMPVGGRKQK